ncbi:MAG: CBS domain-containing protein [Nitrospira sp.]|nr:CBS domain-containing protein [Nitrospira sp.]MDE0405560.1 CBS domain-containing protein [Nitrospira sp.]MDE0487051.1 CBS domain-containing protein [Nitrospira sp.]
MVPVKTFMTPAEKIIAVERYTSVLQAAKLMRDNRIGSVFVTWERAVIGILTETDIARRLVGMGLDANQTPVERIMTSPVMKIDENKTIRDANAMMAREHVRHLGVSRDGALVGMISVRDMVTFVSNLPKRWILGSGGTHILEQIYGRP